MKKLLVTVLFLAAAVAFATPAAAIVCPAPGPFTPNAAQAADIGATGMNCNQVDLILNVDITPITVNNLLIAAKTISITNAKIVNSNAGSGVVLRATGGSIGITGAEIRAEADILIECKSAQCKIDILNSIVKAPINPLGTDGDVRAVAHGDITILGSTFFGGKKVGVISNAGSVTWICQSGTGACLDPVTSGTGVALCGADLVADPTGNTPLIPCTPTFNTLAELKAVCIDPANVQCGGGSTECQVTAQLDVHLENSTITCNSHFLIQSKAQNIFAAGAVLTANTALTLRAQKGVFAPDSTLVSVLNGVQVRALGGIPGPGLCIDLTNADVTLPRTISRNGTCVIDTTGITPP